ncbi:cbb3-type cytochrome c oxidase N-terminal domain-containing protein [Psychroflexus aestuariivivens]|uniref:cbb3-type cytochrome c oxidase N-terminal domain-containing protein n=1 Tax=Psychroflexus aestuariivivens TaxID=1795040 RepID=UPI000FDA1BD6|nr:cbb3-type cytochrome c oxidase N-terminal domain-containing protein [Psychroflexus aestuariivivens]
MRKLSSFLRLIALLGIAWLGVELLLETESGQWAIVEYPMSWLFLGVVFLFALAMEASVSALQNTLYKSLSEEKREKYHELETDRLENLKSKFNWIFISLTRSKPVEEEDEIELDHNYDGIRELDNKLPPWWLYSFYASIVFAAVYLVRFHVFNDYDQIEEYEAEVAQAKIDIEEYKKTAKDLVTIENVSVLEEAADLEVGNQIYLNNCVACHKADGGGGIGPNLTDEHWILGGGIKNVYKTLVEGGRPGKGMVAWKNDFSPYELQQVASYVLSLQGTEPAEPKEPQGEIWEDDSDSE